MVALQERNFSTTGADMYKGHKVVAMPSSGPDGAPLSVRDVVTSRSTFDPNRPRSLSAGRATTRSRDIVQEVYDRMGVNRGGEPFDDGQQHEKGPDIRGRSATPGRGRERSPETADKFSQRYKAAAALSSPARGERGRKAEPDNQRRSRSLSRGRAVAGRWPPAQSDKSVPSFLPRKTEDPVTPSTPPPVRNRTYSRGDSQEEIKADSDSISKDSEEKGNAASVPSIKDRISAYGGRNSGRKFALKKPANYHTYANRGRPAPIDIYEGSRKQEENSKQDDANGDAAVAPEPSTVAPSPAAAAAADAAFAFVRGGSSSRSVKSTGSARTPKANTGIAGAYLGAIKSPGSASNKPSMTHATSAPPTEISAADPGGDGHSVAASSVSADEFNFTSPTTSRSVGAASSKKPSWAERNRPQVSPVGRNPNGGNGGSHYNTNGNKPTSPTASEIERMVEQRVQARVSVVEMRMEEQMQRLEKRMDEKLKARIGMIDEKIDKMNSMLAMLLSRELGTGHSEHRDNEI